MPRLGALSGSKIDMRARCELVDAIIDSDAVRFARVNDEIVNTRANLNFDVFSDICMVCGLNADLFSDKAAFIDVVLLKRRNSIAHGEETFVALGDLNEVSNETIALMRNFGDALEKSCTLEGICDLTQVSLSNRHAPDRAGGRTWLQKRLRPLGIEFRAALAIGSGEGVILAAITTYRY